MKTFHRVDFYIQLVLFTIAGVCLVTSPFGGIIFLFITQFVVGVWQLISGIVAGAGHWKTDTGRLNIRYYWLGVLAWTIGMVLVGVMKSMTNGSNDVIDVAGISWLVASWGLAIYYFALTRKFAFKTQYA